MIDAMPRTKCSRSGFTFVELVVSVTILVLLLGTVGIVQHRGEKAARAIQTTSENERRADRALRMVTKQVAGVGVSKLVPDPSTSFGADTLTFQTPLAVSATGVVTWGNRMRFALAMDDGETDNGLDDDGDGLVDERRLVFTVNVGLANEQTQDICHGVSKWLEGESSNGIDDNGNGVVDEHGFNVRRVGNLLQVRLTVLKQGEMGSIIPWTATTAVLIHN
jgi:type II secretory pathway pseudopilin PulG